MRSGAPAIVYVVGNYSLLVQDQSGRQIIYARSSADFGGAGAVSGDLTQFAANLASPARTLGR